MPGGLTLSQWLTGPEALPTVVARGGAVALVVAATALGYAAGPDGAEPAARPHQPVAASRLAGDLPIATPEPRPALRAAVALPAMRERARRRSGKRREFVPETVPVVAAPPSPAREPKPVATPEPAAPAVPVAAPPAPVAPVAPVAPPPPAAKPAPRSTPAPTFDSSG